MTHTLNYDLKPSTKINFFSIKKFVTFIIATLSILLAQIPASLADTGCNKPEAFIEGVGRDVINILTNKSLSMHQSAERFRGVLHQAFDVPYIGRFVLGKNWRNASPTQIQEYNKLFEELLVNMYVDRFQNYSGETLSVFGSRKVSDSDSVVSGEIKKTNNAPPVKIEWRIRSTDKGCRIIDVLVEGVSMSLTQRSEFSSIIQQNGQGVEGLLNVMRQKYAKQ